MATGLIPERVPAIAPVEPAVSLLTSGARPLPGDIVWKSGITFRTTCPTVSVRIYCVDSPTDLEDPADFDVAEFFPYELYVPYRCDWIKPGNEADELTAEAQAQLRAASAHGISQQLWSSDDTDTPSLMTAGTDVGGSAVHPETALGALLQKYQDCAQSGGAVVHATLQVITALVRAGVIRQQGDVYYGPGGSLVSPGPGYPADSAAGPNGADAGAGNVWTYVTGPVEYAMTGIEVVPDDAARWYDRRSNTFFVWARRQAIHRFDPCCVYAIKTFIPSPAQGESP